MQLVASRAIIYSPSPVAIHQRPTYLYVLQGHQTNWGRFCGRYGACGQPVYFVQENSIRDEYRREHDKRNEYRREHDNRDGKKKFKRHDRQDHDKD